MALRNFFDFVAGTDAMSQGVEANASGDFAVMDEQDELVGRVGEIAEDVLAMLGV